MIRRRALTIAFIVLSAAAFPALSFGADCWTCSNPPGVCFPGGPGLSICTTSCCPNRCHLSGVFCTSPSEGPSSALFSDGARERAEVQNASLAQRQESLILVRAEIR